NYAIGVSHDIYFRVYNYRNISGTVDPVYPMTYHIDWGEYLVSEDAETGIGTNSSYLMAGAVGGAPVPGVVAGSWVGGYGFMMPAGVGGSWALTKVAGSGSFDIMVNGAIKGQIVWSGSTVATFNFPSLVTINVGDLIEVIGNTGVTDPTWTLRGLL